MSVEDRDWYREDFKRKEEDTETYVFYSVDLSHELDHTRLNFIKNSDAHVKEFLLTIKYINNYIF